MISIICMTIVLACLNFCFVQEYSNQGKDGLKRLERLCKPISVKRVLLFLIMMVVMLTVAIYVYTVNKGQMIGFVMRRVCCVSMLFPAATIDMKYHKIPNKLLALYGMMWFVWLLMDVVLRVNGILDTLASSVVSAILILIISIVCRMVVKNGICMGDIKMMMLMALFLGSQSMINAMFISLWVCFFEAIGLMLTKHKGKKDAIAFAPSVLVGTVASMLLTGY